MKNDNHVFDLFNVTALVEKAHDGQVDKGGHPYIGHLERVLARVRERLAALPEGLVSPADQEQALLLALGHDLLEDTSVTEEELRALGADDLFMRRLKLLSRLDKSSTYIDWIWQLAASDDLVAIIVKLGDNEDNNDPARIAQLPEAERTISQRYIRAHRVLSAALEHKLQRSQEASPDNTVGGP